MASKFTVQSIASTSFGIEANQFDDSPQGAQFYQMTRKGPCVYDVHIGRKRGSPQKADVLREGGRWSKNPNLHGSHQCNVSKFTEGVTPTKLLKMMAKALVGFVLYRKMRSEIISHEATNYFADIIKQQLRLRRDKSKRRNDMIDLLTEAYMGDAANDEEVSRQVEEELEVTKPSRVSALKGESSTHQLMT